MGRQLAKGGNVNNLRKRPGLALRAGEAVTQLS